MSTTRGRRQRGGRSESDAAAEPVGAGVLRSWLIVVLIGIGVWAVFFGIPALVRHVNAPPISEDFGLEDAVVALRLYADDVSYLVLVNEAGQARSVQLEERGFENSGFAWSDAGLSTGGPADEYLLREDGLTRLPLPHTSESTGETGRFAIADGFAVYNGSAEGQQLAFVDAERNRLTAIDMGYRNPALATCDDELVLVDEAGVVRALTPETREFDGLGLFSGAGTLVCDQDRVYGFDEIIDEEDSAHQTLRIWDRETGAVGEVEIRYPRSVLSWRPGTPFVWEGRLYWSAEYRLWSIPLPDPLASAPASGTAEAVTSAELSGFLGDLSPVVGTDDGVLVHEGGRVFGVAEETDFVNPSKGPAYDRLLDLAIFSADAVTGERRVEITIDGIDFPMQDVNVEAIAVDPEWAARR